MITKEVITEGAMWSSGTKNKYISTEDQTPHWLTKMSSSQHEYCMKFPFWKLNCWIMYKGTSKFYVLKKEARNPIFYTKYLKSRPNRLLNIMCLIFEILIYLLLFMSTTSIIFEYIYSSLSSKSLFNIFCLFLHSP